MLKRMLKKLSVLCVLAAALSSCGPEFDDKPSTGYANGTAPSAPTGVAATVLSATSIRISWNTVSGVDGYIVYCSRSPNGEYLRLSNDFPKPGTSHDDDGCEPGDTWYYKVSAIKGSIANGYWESAKSSAVSATTSNTPGEGAQSTVPSIPTNVTATRLSANNVSVTWNAVSGATHYEVYWAYTASGEYTLDGTPTSASFTSTDWGADESGCFKVKAVNSAGSSGYSSIAFFGAYSSGSSAPSIPTGVTATAASSSSITVSWSAVSGATGYYVYRATSSSGSYSYRGASTSTSYTGTGLPANTTYYYKVSAYNDSGESGQSSYAYATTLSPTPSIPSAPTNVTATTASSSSITVSWSAVSGATIYYVYWATSSSGPYSSYAGYSESTSFIHTGLSANTTYYYKVLAYNSYGASEQSSYAYATTSSSTPAAPSTGSSLTQGYWTNGTISSSSSTQYYYFYATSGSSYTVKWNDSYEGDNTKTCDVKVSAYWYSNNTSIFSNEDHGYTNGKTFTASRTGYVMLKVEPYFSSDTGSFAIGYQ